MKRFLFNTKSFTITLLIVNLFFTGAAFGQTTRTWLPTAGGAWTTGANWDTGLPVAGDIVIINSNQSAAITAVPSISLNTLTVSGNCSLSGAGAPSLITVTSAFSVSATRTLTLGVAVNANRVNLTLAGSATGTIDGTVTLSSGTSHPVFTNSGDLTISASGLINQVSASDFSLNAAGTLRVSSPSGISTTAVTGNIQLTGTRTYTAGGNIEYNGTAAQVTGNALPATCNIIINNSAGVTLTVATIIAGSLTMTSGTLNMADLALTVGSLTGSGNITNTTGGIVAQTITIGSNGASPAAYSGAISNGTNTGGVSVTKTGAGTLTLSGLNTYTGLTTISTGSLLYAANDVLSTGAVTVSGGIFDISTFTDAVGTVTLTSGTIAGTSGVLTATSFAVQAGTVTAILGGTGTLTKTTAGTVILSALNTYTGKTMISAGTLNINSIESTGVGNSSIGNPSSAANGIIDIAGTTGVLLYTGSGHTSNRVINITADGGIIDASGSGTLTLTGGITALSFNSVLTGNGDGIESGVIATGVATLTKNGTGTWTLSGANTYSQATTISAGILKLGASSAVATSGPLGTTGAGTTISAGLPAALDMNGFSLTGAAIEALNLNGTGISSGGALTNSSATAVTYSGAITLQTSSSIIANAGDINITNASLSGGAGDNLTIGGSGNGTVSSNISNGSGGLTKIGTGTWTLSGSSSYSGATMVNGGTLKAAVATQAFGSASNVTLANTTAVILDLNGFSNTLGSLAGGGINGGDITLGAATLTTGGNNASTSYAGIISGTGSVIKAGSGTWTVSGFNSYTGKTTINAGTLSINSIENVSAGSSSVGNPSSVPNGTIDIAGTTGVLMYTGSGSISDRVINLTSDGGGINASGTGGLTLTGGVTGLTFNLILTGTGGGLESGVINTTSGTLTKSGTGTWTLSGANLYAGLTTISAGTLKLGVSSAVATSGPLGTTGAGTIVTSALPAALDMNGFSLTGTATEALTLNGTGISNSGALTNSTGGATTYSGLITKGSATSIVADAGDINITNPGTITGNFLLTLGGFANGNITSIINSTGGITKTGAGTWNLGAAAVSVSTLTITTGTLVATSATMNVTGNFSNSATFTHNAGTINFNGGAAQTIGGSSVTTFNNLIINSAGVSLTNNEIVNAVLTLTSGILTIPTGNILTIANGNTIAGTLFSATKHITTTVNTVSGAKGFLQVNNMTASAAYLFPVGSATSYLPVTLTPSDATVANNSFNVCSFSGITTDGEPNGPAFTATQKSNCVNAVWTVNYNGSGTPLASPADMMVGWPAALEGTNFAGYANSSIGIAHWDNPNWGIPEGSGDNAANTATRVGITTFSPFAVGKNLIALPIKIIYFNAAKENGYNSLTWQANCTSAQVVFEVLRSSDGINFTAITAITVGQPDCGQQLNYHDNTATGATVYYRLRIIDTGGQESYSAIVKLSSQVKDIQLTGIAPNPVVNTALLKISTTKKDVVYLTIISLEGKVVYRNSVQLQSGSSVVSLDITNLPGGMYMIKGMFSDGQSNTIQFTKK